MGFKKANRDIDLNRSEAAVLKEVRRSKSPFGIHIVSIQRKAFALAEGTLETRNALRRLVDGDLVEKVARGTYRVTDTGRKP